MQRSLNRHVQKICSIAQSGSRLNQFTTRNFRSSSFSLQKEDYYKSLGAEKGASKSELKKKYFDLAKKYHPDVNKEKGAEERFKKISEAYEVLQDDQKRQQYDNFGHAGVGNGDGGGGGNPFGGGGNPFGGFGGFGGGGMGGQGVHFNGNMSQEDLFNIFNQAFGGQGRNQGPRRGSDAQLAMALDFLEAVNGCNKDIRTEYIEVDKGSGRRARKTRVVNVTIPAGVDTGVILRVAGKGNTGDEGMPPGDLLLHLEVRDDPYFQRVNYDVHVELPISVSQAVLGGLVDVLTLDGMVEMKVPAGTQPGAQLSMKGKGIKAVNSGRRGAQVVHLNLKVPTKLTARQKELMVEFAQEENEQKMSNGSAKKERSFVEAAWSRLKNFLGEDDAATSKGKGKGKDTDKGTDKGTDKDSEKEPTASSA